MGLAEPSAARWWTRRRSAPQSSVHPYGDNGMNPRDPDARVTMKRKTAHFGYKAPLAVDEESGLVRQARETRRRALRGAIEQAPGCKTPHSHPPPSIQPTESGHPPERQL